VRTRGRRRAAVGEASVAAVACGALGVNATRALYALGPGVAVACAASVDFAACTMPAPHSGTEQAYAYSRAVSGIRGKQGAGTCWLVAVGQCRSRGGQHSPRLILCSWIHMRTRSSRKTLTTPAAQRVALRPAQQRCYMLNHMLHAPLRRRCHTNLTTCAREG
jgi:hypothetical protein